MYSYVWVWPHSERHVVQLKCWVKCRVQPWLEGRLISSSGNYMYIAALWNPLKGCVWNTNEWTASLAHDIVTTLLQDWTVSYMYIVDPDGGIHLHHVQVQDSQVLSLLPHTLHSEGHQMCRSYHHLTVAVTLLQTLRLLLRTCVEQSCYVCMSFESH